MRKARIAAIGLGVLILLGLVAFGIRLIVHARAVAALEAELDGHRPARLTNLGSTETLRVLPLVDWHSSRSDLKGDMGVSYLVETDSVRILFDTGNNSTDSEPSPLEHNMKALGLGLEAFDTVFISHAHFDHIGGSKWADGLSGATFGIGNRQPNLKGKRVFVPTPMTYPGLTPTLTREPTRIAPGVASTGTIPRRLFPGQVDEQALVVNVRGKGLVLIVGCGHQTMPRLIERVEAVFEEPIYGVIGGLHYPVPEGRLKAFGFDLQRRFGSGSGPLSPLGEDDVRREMDLLAQRKPGFVAVGGHDTSDDVIEWFRARFGAAHHPVRVGEALIVEN